jgi:hypothetical protein
MAIGDTVQAGLGRMDFSAFQKAGAAQAQANQAFGKAIEKAAIGFFQGQEKKKKKQEMVQGLTMLFPDAPPELVNAMAKNPEVTQAKLNLDRFNLEVDKFNKDAEVSDQQVAMMNQAMQNTQADRLLAEQNRKDTENFYNFMGKPGPDQIDPSGPDRNSVLRLIRAGKGVTSPARMIPGPPPAEQLVVSKEAKEFIRNAIEQGQPIRKVITMGQQIDQQIERTQPKARTPEEEAKYQGIILENQRKALELEQKTNPEPTASLEYTDATINAISDAENILNNSKLPVTGLWGNALKNIPGTSSADLKNSINTIYASIGFDKLQNIRKQSKTGGALGAVSDRELALLKASLGSLEQSQSAEQFKKNLMRVKDHYQKYYKATMALKEAYQQGLKFDTEEKAMSWYDKNFPMASKPTPDNQTNITTPGGFVLSEN